MILRLFHRWIDKEWLRIGLTNANPSYPPWRLELLPIAIIVSSILVDFLQLARDFTKWPIFACFLFASLIHCYFMWRLIFITSMTEISEQLSRGEEPDPTEVLKFTEPKQVS